MKIIDDGTVTLPKGFYGAGDHVGIKKEKKDLALIYSEVDAPVSYTHLPSSYKEYGEAVPSLIIFPLYNLNLVVPLTTS